MFIAPELWEGQPATPRTDLYSAAATLHLLWQREPPFSGPTAFELAREHCERPYVPPPTTRSGRRVLRRGARAPAREGSVRAPGVGARRRAHARARRDAAARAARPRRRHRARRRPRDRARAARPRDRAHRRDRRRREGDARDAQRGRQRAAARRRRRARARRDGAGPDHDGPGRVDGAARPGVQGGRARGRRARGRDLHPARGAAHAVRGRAARPPLDHVPRARHRHRRRAARPRARA